ncbi:MAG: thiamine diphosphokinase [Syntrophomonadaceae bacterium]|jgi:thiamine pyrophosphokinase
MKCVILANGEYNNLVKYLSLIEEADIILGADGGANYAYAMGVIPYAIVGDMDSLRPEAGKYFQQQGVKFKRFPSRKDFTDTQLTLALAEEMGANEIILCGSVGKRLDHTLANLYSGIELALKGVKICHYTDNFSAYLVTREIIINGEPGDTVSVLAISDLAQGVSGEGFEYPLNNLRLKKSNPYAISNILIASRGIIRVKEGLLLVLHYPDSKEL